MKVAVAQIDSGNNEAENLAKMSRMIREAAENGAELILFPEHAIYLGEDMKGHAHSDHDAFAETLSEIARENHIYLHCGSFSEKREKDDNPYNSSLFFDKEGKLLAKYSKIHLFEADIPDGASVREADTVKAGEEITLAETEFGKAGFAICYDLRFPELFYQMAKAGAKLIFMPANFTAETGKAHWEILLRARAIENTCYILAAGQIGKKPEFHAYGHSMIIDPWGEVLAEAGEGEELIYAQLSEERLKEVRQQMPSLRNHRL
jgi:deaminated glutathione amidase